MVARLGRGEPLEMAVAIMRCLGMSRCGLSMFRRGSNLHGMGASF